MNVSCPECRSIFRIDPAKVPATGVRARCSVCGGILAIGGGSLPVSVTPYSGVLRIVGTPAGVPSVGAAATVPVPRLTPTLAIPMVAVPPSPPVGGPAPVTSTGPGPPAYSERAVPAAVVAPVATPPVGTPAVSVPVTAPPVVSPPVSVAAPTPVASPAVPAPSSVPAGERRPINPFLQVDPVQRARRLARALVSDLVAYHPQKREEGLRDGTLRQLFREDIKKSYEEYVEQVGQEVAEQAPFFQEALNDILAGGRRLF